MKNLSYKLHYHARRLVNRVLFQTLYRLMYPGGMAYAWIAAGQGFSRHSIKFILRETDEGILSCAPGFSSESTVMDVGGDTGVWATQIYKRYAPHMLIYEPNPKSLIELHEKFDALNADIYPFGLGASNRTSLLSDDGMGSSLFDASPTFGTANKFEVQIRDIREIIGELDYPDIDMLKVNIEGGEYELLPAILDAGLANRFRIIRIQFHDWIPNGFAMRRAIVSKLALTHDIEWSYPMVWESWVRKESN